MKLEFDWLVLNHGLRIVQWQACKLTATGLQLHILIHTWVGLNIMFGPGHIFGSNECM